MLIKIQTIVKPDNSSLSGFFYVGMYITTYFSIGLDLLGLKQEKIPTHFCVGIFKM
jgi:hypothetical protein